VGVSGNAQLVVQENSRQNPKPGYGSVFDNSSPLGSAFGELKYELYFDGGTERKLQVRKLSKSLCKVHANWQFQSADLA